MRNRQPATTGIHTGALGGILFGVLIAAAPGTAFGAEKSGEMPAVVLGTVMILLLVLGVGLLALACVKLRSSLAWTRRDLVQASHFEAIVSALPGGLFWWDHATGAEHRSKGLAEFFALPPDTPPRFPDILDQLEEEAQEALKKAVARLREEGAGFTISIATAKTGRSFEVTGLRITEVDETNLADLMWLRETTIEGAEAK